MKQEKNVKEVVKVEEQDKTKTKKKNDVVVYEDNGWNDEMVLLDAYDTPIMVNRAELRSTAKQRYAELMNEWLAEWNKLKKVRKAEDV